MGVGNYAEADVYAGARVFTGWNLARPNGSGDTRLLRVLLQRARSTTRPRRSSRSRSTPTAAGRFPRAPRPTGMQDGIDLIDAVVRHPATGPRLARKLYGYFINEVDAPDAALIDDMASDYYRSGFEIKPMLIRLFTSPQFTDPSNYFKRYSWPAEFVVARDQGDGLGGLLGRTTR